MIQEQIQHPHLEKLRNIGQFIGHTPLFPITGLHDKPGVKIYAKLEWQQLGGSVKARPAYNIIKEAMIAGAFEGGRSLLDASSGNTAIAYAAIGAALDIPVTICLPQNASEERKRILRAFGAEVIYTSRFGGTDEAQEHAEALHREQPDRYYYASQYTNDHNWKAHYKTTAEEIYKQTLGEVSHFVAGLGTTGTFTGTSRRLLELNPGTHLTSLQPDAALHGMEGWKHMETAIVPKIYDDTLAHQNLAIDTFAAYDLIKKAAAHTGLLLSPSAGAALAGALQVADQIEEGTIVTVFADNAEKYSDVLDKIFA